MKEKVLYDAKNDCIWLAQKDQRTLINGKWIQDWWVYNGSICFRPKSNKDVIRKTKSMSELESATYLDKYR